MGMAKSFAAKVHLLFKGIAAQSVSSITSIDGDAITEPWKLGRRLTFLWIFGAFAGTASGLAIVQGKKRSDGNWENVVDKDGNALQIPAAKLDDAGALESNPAWASVDLSNIDSTTYSALRARFTNEVAVAMLIACAYILDDLYEIPSGQADEIRDLQKVR